MSYRFIAQSKALRLELDLAQLDQVCGGSSKLGSGTDGVHCVGSEPAGITDRLVPLGSKLGGVADGRW